MKGFNNKAWAACEIWLIWFEDANVDNALNRIDHGNQNILSLILIIIS